jgi:hypothetical protein
MSRHRRTDKEMDNLFAGVVNILGQYSEPISIRHLFYRCANEGLIDKTEKAYNGIRAHLARWRERKMIPYDAFVDATRYYYGRQTFNDINEYLRHCAATYRLNLWKYSDYYLEVWCEKDAVAASVHNIVQEWNLKTFVCRGDPSMSSLHSAAQTFNLHRAEGFQPVILYVGDYDESGLAIPKTIREKLLKNHDCEVQVNRVGVNEDHIKAYNLPTRPAKGDRRGESISSAVDIDAMRPTDLREILANEIESYVDEWQLDQLRAVEESERTTLASTKITSNEWDL